MQPENAAAPGVGTERERENDNLTTSDDTALAAETALAGALLIVAEDLADEALHLVADEDLAEPKLRFIVSTRRRMVADGVSCSPVAFGAYVDKHALLKPGPSRTHLASFVHRLAANCDIPMSAGWYADAVALQAARRRLATAGRHLVDLAAGGDEVQVTEALDAVKAVA